MMMLVYGLLAFVIGIVLWGMLSSPSARVARVEEKGAPDAQSASAALTTYAIALGVAIVLMGLLAGCTTLAGLNVPGDVVDLTAEEAAFIEDFRARASRAGATLNPKLCPKVIWTGRPSRCAPPVVVIEGFTKPYGSDRRVFSPSTVGIYVEDVTGMHWVLARPIIHTALREDVRAQVLLAHEIAHWLHRDPSRIRFQGVSPQQTERDANAAAPQILVLGWGMTSREALEATWAMLVAEAASGREPTGSHGSGCAELRDFEQRYSLRPVPLAKCYG